MMKLIHLAVLIGFASATLHAEVKMTSGTGTLNFSGGEGPGKGKHVVLLAGDEEYRSEEVMPILAKMLAEKHGFETTVLFSADEDGTINPTATTSLMGAEALDKAHALVMLLRFRNWNDEAMGKFKSAIDRGVPVIALRTSTHAFNTGKGGKWADMSWNHPTGGFGRRVLGETWISHWGVHKKEATKTVIEPGSEKSPLLKGVSEVFGDTDVYEAAPPEDAKILLRGIVLKGMNPTDEPANYEKKTKKGEMQKVNEPTMPVAWTREVKNEAGTTNKILTTTMGAATEIVDEDLRRLIVNGVYWGLGLDVPEKADVTISAEFKPSNYGFKGFKPNMKAADFVK
ncbi:MAG: ThuA domain-containing protein [Akkermansiaceae bacterium]